MSDFTPKNAKIPPCKSNSSSYVDSSDKKHETQDCEISLQERGVYLSAARDLLKTSRNIFQQYAGSGFNTERKKDRSFITEVDTTIENALRKELYHAFPEHGVPGRSACHGGLQHTFSRHITLTTFSCRKRRCLRSFV